MSNSLYRQSQPEKLSGKTYSGVVVDNNDPLKLQRIKVRSNDIHDNIDDGDLPWLAQNTSTSQGASSSIGEIAIPAIGTTISFEFLDESQYHGQYSGSLNSSSNKHPELVAGNYPHVVGSVDGANNILINDTSTGEWQFTFKAGTNFHQLPGGELRVGVAAGFTLIVNGAATINTMGKTSIYSQSEIEISAPIIKMNPSTPPAPTLPTARS